MSSSTRASSKIWGMGTFDWVAPTAGTYRLRVTSFESINTGDLIVTRD